jgi:hypothetical protein
MVSITKTLMPLKQPMAVYSENDTKHTNTLGGPNTDFLSIKAGGTQCALEH